ncbi:DNA-binding response regulator [Haloferula helveola]|uniref:DNA-binding response regulator n=2 Tax=Haloferula helveola TaxID=490095 RepID=A0ABM7RD99_9BACT|nr:DNA-binding response regulator [Haloferula helveola]
MQERKGATCIRVALVEDQLDTRESWRRLISSFPDFECTCVCASAEDALRMIPENLPDVVLMDVFLPRMSGIECTARLKAMKPDIPIVMLTASDEDEILFLALESGADGYLLKRTKPADLRAALLDVLNGGAPMTSEIARHVVASFRKKSGLSDPSVALTHREEETLVLLTKGYSNKEIADHLGIGIETVRSHLKNIYTKMHVRSRTEAVAHYMSRRLG